MQRHHVMLFLGALTAIGLGACGSDQGGGQGGSGPGPSPLVSYVGTTGVFAAYFDPTQEQFDVATIGSYAGKRQDLHGTVDFLTGASLGQAAGVEIYKGSDGHVYALDLAATSAPSPQQISSESAATIDDTCSLSGTQVSGANYDYVGVNFSGDLLTPTNSSYFYRLPGPDGVCNTADDIIHLVKTGMAPTDAPIVASAMPLAAVKNAQGGITGFVAKSGANLVLVDTNFANPVVLGSFANPINVATAIGVGTTQGYPTGQFYLVDGSIYYVNYATPGISAALFTVPNWTPTNQEVSFAASPTTLYFSIYTAAAGTIAASTSIYAMPADGSAAPTIVATETGRATSLTFPVQGSALVYALIDPTGTTYALRVLAPGVAPATIASGNGNVVAIVATATKVYYDAATQVTNSTAMTIVRSGTTAGIVGFDGSVIQAPLAGATFVSGGEAQPWPDDLVTTATPFLTLFQVQKLTTATVTDAATGYTITADAVSGGTMYAIDASSNSFTVMGGLTLSTAMGLTGTFRGTQDTQLHTGFLDATNLASTNDPATRDLYLLDSQTAGSLTQASTNLNL
jgi:hypothetical protein